MTGSVPNPGVPNPGDTDNVPQDATTLMAVLTAARDLGYGGGLQPAADATVTCSQCHASSAAGDLTVDRVQRLEGVSDAADMLLVAAATCPACGRGGTAVLGYGPNAGEADAAVATDLRIEHAAPVII